MKMTLSKGETLRTVLHLFFTYTYSLHTPILYIHLCSGIHDFEIYGNLRTKKVARLF